MVRCRLGARWPLLLGALALSTTTSVDAIRPLPALNLTLAKLRNADVAGAFNHPHYEIQRHGAVHEKAVAVSRRLATSTTEEQASAKADEVGEKVRDGIKQLRGGDDKFYDDLITAVSITMCEQTSSNQDRFVLESSDNAYKYGNDSCILLLNPDQDTLNSYNSGYCEVKPNCYWADFAATDSDRSTVYAESSTMDATGAKAKLKSYAQSVGMFAAPGIILAVLSLLTFFFFLLCRCCCNKCGGRKAREGGYSCMEKFLPVLFFMLFGIGIIACAGAAFLYRDKALDGVTIMFDGTTGTIDNATYWTYNLSSPLEEVRDTVIDAAGDISTALDGIDYIAPGMAGLVSSLRTFGSYSQNRTLPEGCDKSKAYCIPCTFCTTIHDEVESSASQIEGNAGPAVSSLDEIHSQLDSQLVGIADTVKDSVNEQVSLLVDVRASLTKMNGKVGDVRKYFDDYKKYIGLAILAIFAIGVVVVAIGFIGVFFGLTPCKFLANIMHLAWFIGFIALFITFLIAAISLALSVLLGDLCEVVDIFSGNWTVPLGDSGEVVDACFTNTSLLVALNLTDKFAFAEEGGLNFPTFNVNNAIDFSALDAFSAGINSTNSSTFSFNVSLIQDNIDQLNALTSQTDTHCNPNDNNNYTITNIQMPWVANYPYTQNGTENGTSYISNRYGTANLNLGCPANGGVSSSSSSSSSAGYGSGFTCEYADQAHCYFGVKVVEVYETASNLQIVSTSVSDFVTQLHNNATVVTNYANVFKSNITDMSSAVDTIKTNLTSSLIAEVNEFKAAMYCTFVKTGYDTIFYGLCTKLMPSLTMLALLLYIVGFFLIPVNVCLIIGVKRLKARGNGGHVMDNEMKFK